jgi:hypothetical protein
MDIHQISEGQEVEIDLTGLLADGVTLGAGIYGLGRVTGVNVKNDEAVVRLDRQIAGKDEVVVPAERIQAVATSS